MIPLLRVTQLNGDTQIFDQLKDSTKIGELKNIIFSNNCIFKGKVNKVKKSIKIKLLYEGIELEDNQSLKDLDLKKNNNLILNIVSNSLDIKKNVSSLVNNYKLSPCENDTDEDIFMDSFDGFNNSSSVKTLIKEIRQELSEMKFIQDNILEKINNLESRLE